MVYYRKPHFASLRHLVRACRAFREPWSTFYDHVLPGPERSDALLRLRRHTTRVPPDFWVSQISRARTHKIDISQTKNDVRPGSD